MLVRDGRSAVADGDAGDVGAEADISARAGRFAREKGVECRAFYLEAMLSFGERLDAFIAPRPAHRVPGRSQKSRALEVGDADTLEESNAAGGKRFSERALAAMLPAEHHDIVAPRRKQARGSASGRPGSEYCDPRFLVQRLTSLLRGYCEFSRDDNALTAVCPA